MVLSAGILTARGGMTSHAAVVARGMGKVNLKLILIISVVFVDGEKFSQLMKKKKD